jgi:hypothetical protein
MLRALNTAILAALLLLFGVIVFTVLETPPSTQDLDSDIAEIRQRMKQVTDLRQKYEGGAIKVLMDLNHEILSTTEAMLLQKRAATLRHVNLDYRINGRPIEVATAEALKAIEDDRADAQKKAEAAQAEADRYTGGLIQGLALMKAQTEKLSVSVLSLKYYSAKYGIALPIPPLGDAPPKKEPPGRVVKDKDAL